jgi:hypothetical protein
MPSGTTREFLPVVSIGKINSTSTTLPIGLAFLSPSRTGLLTKAPWRLQAPTEGRTARKKLCDRSMPLLETGDARSGVQGCPGDGRRRGAVPKTTFEDR